MSPVVQDEEANDSGGLSRPQGDQGQQGNNNMTQERSEVGGLHTPHKTLPRPATRRRNLSTFFCCARRNSFSRGRGRYSLAAEQREVLSVTQTRAKRRHHLHPDGADVLGAHQAHQSHHARQSLAAGDAQKQMCRSGRGWNAAAATGNQPRTTHHFLAVLLSCAGAEQLHVEESQDPQQLGLQVVSLKHSNATFR